MNAQMPEAGTHKPKVLSVFDFDGTLTRHDSFVPFLKFAFGKRVFASRMVRLLPAAIRYASRGMTRDELKAVLIATFLTGVKVEWVEAKAIEFHAACWNRLMRPPGVKSVAAEVASGAQVTLCSASPVLVLAPFAKTLGIKLIATELEVREGYLTGGISGNNCRCEAKVLRLEAIYGPLGQYHVRAWGDTRGDHELLSAAQDAHWRHFHPAWQRGRGNVAKRVRGVNCNEATINLVVGACAPNLKHDDHQGA